MQQNNYVLGLHIAKYRNKLKDTQTYFDFLTLASRQRVIIPNTEYITSPIYEATVLFWTFFILEWKLFWTRQHEFYNITGLRSFVWISKIIFLVLHGSCKLVDIPSYSTASCINFRNWRIRYTYFYSNFLATIIFHILF